VDRSGFFLGGTALLLRLSFIIPHSLSTLHPTNHSCTLPTVTSSNDSYDTLVILQDITLGVTTVLQQMMVCPVNAFL
jgi:hypothetical protein